MRVHFGNHAVSTVDARPVAGGLWIRTVPRGSRPGNACVDILTQVGHHCDLVGEETGLNCDGEEKEKRNKGEDWAQTRKVRCAQRTMHSGRTSLTKVVC